MMSVVLLVLVWLLVLVPQALKERAEQRRDFVDSFQRNLEALSRGEQPPVATVKRRRSPAERRRRIVAGLLLSVVVSVVPAVALPGKASLVVHLAVDNCFLAYIALLVRLRDSRVPAVAPAPQPDIVLTPALVQPLLG